MKQWELKAFWGKKRIVFSKQWRAGTQVRGHDDVMKRMNVRNILVPIDFSKMSSLAIEMAQRLARQFTATVHLVHVRHFYYPADLTAPVVPIAPPLYFTYDRESEQIVAHQLNAFAKKHDLAPVICHVLTGAPAFDEICRLAKEIPADLIVMPTHGHTGLKHVFFGSTAERVVQHSPCPVFVARKSRTALTINTILVPVDFSRCSLKGLEYAIAFAEKYAARIVLLHVLHLGYAYTADGLAMYDISDLTKAAEKHAQQQMRAFVRMAKFARVKFETAIRTGVAVVEIAAFAKKVGADLIITGTHGRTGFSHVLIGSVAENIVRRASCSVLVVPSHPQERAKHLTRAKRTRQLPPPRPLRAAMKQNPREPEQFTKRFRKVTSHPLPERRKTNKFRESHSAAATALG